MTTPPDEHFEQIPWEELLAEHDQRRRRLTYLSAAAVGVAALTAVTVRAWWPAPAAVPATSPSSAASAPQPPATSPPRQPPPSPAASVYREADLVAVDPAQLAAIAAAYAEWFTADYFTRHGSGGRLGEWLGEAAPEGGEGRSFVESVHAVETVALEQSRFRVTVVVRTLEASGEGEYQAVPPRAAAVVVELTPQGVMVADLPSPTALPPRVPPPLAVATETVPGEVAAAATERARLWGEVAVVGGSRTEAGWRVEATVTGAGGVAWPVVVEVPEGG